MNARLPNPSNPLVSALARWNNEGGAQPATPAEESESILLHLGAAVLMQWNHLPRAIQRELFDAASKMEEPHSDTNVVRHQMALFLHAYKNRDSDTADVGGGD